MKKLSLTVALIGVFAASLLLLTPSASTQTAPPPDCQAGRGGMVFSRGGDVVVEILQGNPGAAFTSEIRLLSPEPARTPQEILTALFMQTWPVSAMERPISVSRMVMRGETAASTTLCFKSERQPPMWIHWRSRKLTVRWTPTLMPGAGEESFRRNGRRQIQLTEGE